MILHTQISFTYSRMTLTKFFLIPGTTLSVISNNFKVLNGAPKHTCCLYCCAVILNSEMQR